MRHVCKLILTKMIEAGFDVADPKDVDSWSEEDVAYIVDNYAPFYIK